MQTIPKLRILLLPFSWLYGGFMALRNWFFSKGLTKSFRFDFPVISVGNLSTGGTGKTPHIEFIISLLKEKYKVGVVSRGYGRKTKGFFVVEESSTATQVGDEPLQIKLNHPQAAVAVGEQRILAIPSLLHEAPETEVVLLDDAYQHRYVQPGLNILLTDYSRPFYTDYVLPAGNLREFRAGYKRADIIVVTKCPTALTIAVKKEIRARIKPQEHQKVFFSSLKYGTAYKFGAASELLTGLKQKHVLFFAGIANTATARDYLLQNTASHEVMKLADHFNYTPSNLASISERFKTISGENKILLTTQKDAVKLMQQGLKEIVGNWPLYILPVEIDMGKEEKHEFIACIETYIAKELSIQAQ